MTIADHIENSPILTAATALSLEDGTLSGNERRIAKIVHAILDGADGLDAKQLLALVEPLRNYAAEVQDQEQRAWKILESRGFGGL